MLSRRWAAAASSRSDSVRTRSAAARASLSEVLGALLGVQRRSAGPGPRPRPARAGRPPRVSSTRCRIASSCAWVAACCSWNSAARALPALGQGGLEVRGGLGRVGALLLEGGLGLLAQRGGVPLGGVALLVGGAPGVGQDPGAFGVGVAAALLGVLVGFVADRDGGLLGVLAGRLDLGLGHLAQLPGLLLGQAEDLADPLAEMLERSAPWRERPPRPADAGLLQPAPLRRTRAAAARRSPGRRRPGRSPASQRGTGGRAGS